MTNKHRNGSSRLSETILELLNGTISQEQSEQLKKLLMEDSNARKYYVEFLVIHSYLKQNRDLSKDTSEPVSAISDDSALWEALAENERTAAGIKIEGPD